MITTRSIFQELEGRFFPDSKSLREALADVYIKYIAVLPVEIGPRDLIEVAIKKHWIKQREEDDWLYIETFLRRRKRLRPYWRMRPRWNILSPSMSH